MGQNLGNGVRSSVTGVAVDDVSGSQVAVSSGRPCCFGPASSNSRNFREICNTPPIHGYRVNRSSRGWIFPMGRKAKGDRHTIFTSMPTEAAQIVKAEATSLGCYIGDYIGWLVCDHFELSAEVPIGEVTDHPDPLPAANGRVRYRAMLPREAADLVIPRPSVVATPWATSSQRSSATDSASPLSPASRRRPSGPGRWLLRPESSCR